MIIIPQYLGLETEFEDIVYSFLRKELNERGYSFKVKRTGFSEIDNIIASYSGGNTGKGACDGYIFKDTSYKSILGLIELESTGKIDFGIKQIVHYAKSLCSSSLDNVSKLNISKIENRDLLLIVYDGTKLYISLFNIDTQKETIIIDKESLESSGVDLTRSFFSYFPKKSIIIREDEEKELINQVASTIRGHEKLQKNKALLMTILSSIYGATQKGDFKDALTELESSQYDYDVKLYDTYKTFVKEISEVNDKNKLSLLYEKTASKLFELSQDRGMDLYGFIYEELASKENKKEQGEYYTPRHTITPLIKGVFNNYLNWVKDDLSSKIVFDPFCGSGGFLYEYLNLIKSRFNLTKPELDKLATKSLYGVDKNNVLATYLNLFLIGDGSANIKRVNSSINWRKQFIFKNDAKVKFKFSRISDERSIKYNFKSVLSDIQMLLKLYGNQKINIDAVDIEGLEKEANPMEKFVLKQLEWINSDKDERYLGNVDLLLTNVPYGKVTEANEQFIENGESIYGNSLEANALRECVDFLKPAKSKNGKIIEDGGIAICIIPDSILENPSNKAIRDYLISRCNILSIIGLPPYTFSPYAMEKTYAIIFQKIAPEQFNYYRKIDLNTFMYYSLCDGRANSQNRYKTDLIKPNNVITIQGNRRVVNEYIHNDFEPNFESYDENTFDYKSKLEWAWCYAFADKNPNWDQERILENWNGNDWEREEGKKWGYFKIQKINREIEREIKKKSLQDKIESFLTSLDEKLIEHFVAENNFDNFKKALQDFIKLSVNELEKLNEATSLKAVNVLGRESYILTTNVMIEDFDLNPDSTNYLAIKDKEINIDELEKILEELGSISEADLIKFFRNTFYSNKLEKIRLADYFDILQGTQFSKRDAYSYPGKIPVYTAATDGPAYYVSDKVQGKVKVDGPSLIWSRKGAKAGTIQIYGKLEPFYISDVSGTIKPKSNLKNFDLKFLKYYIAGQVKKELQSVANNAQLNKSKLENLKIYLPNNQKKISNRIEKILIK